MKHHHHEGGEHGHGHGEKLTHFERKSLDLLRELVNLSHRQLRELDRIRVVLENGGPGNPHKAVAFAMKFSKPKHEKD